MKPHILIICPSRGRPTAAGELHWSYNELAKPVASTLWFVVPEAERPAYIAAGVPNVLPIPIHDLRDGFVDPLNLAWETLRHRVPHSMVMFIGDDFRFLCPFDQEFLAANADIGGGWIHGNDGIQAANLMTHAAIDRRIVEALGWVACPLLRHMYSDNIWTDLALTTGRGRYLAHIGIPHIHHIIGAAQYDPTYDLTNRTEHFAEAKQIYLEDAFPRVPEWAALVLQALNAIGEPAADSPTH